MRQRQLLFALVALAVPLSCGRDKQTDDAPASGGAPGTGGSAGASGTVQFRAGSLRTGSFRSDQPSTLTLPASIQGQDGLLLAHIIYGLTTPSNATDAGFELIATATAQTTPSVMLRIFWKVAAGPAGQPTTEPATLSVTSPMVGYQTLMLFAVHGYDPTAPIATSTTAGGEIGDVSVAGISVLRPGSLGLFWKASWGNSTTRTPDGWTVVVRNQDGTNDIAWRPLDIGPTGDVKEAQSAGSWATVLTVVQPP